MEQLQHFDSNILRYTHRNSEYVYKQGANTLTMQRPIFSQSKKGRHDIKKSPQRLFYRQKKKGMPLEILHIAPWGLRKTMLDSLIK